MAQEQPEDIADVRWRRPARVRQPGAGMARRGGQIGRADRTPDDPLLLIFAVSVLADPARTGAPPW